MADSQVNSFGVKVGQIWKDNDVRGRPGRRFRIVEVDEGYYPLGRARCEVLGKLSFGQRPEFFARLPRFNGTRRGYTQIVQDGEAAE